MVEEMGVGVRAEVASEAGGAEGRVGPTVVEALEEVALGVQMAGGEE